MATKGQFTSPPPPAKKKRPLLLTLGVGFIGLCVILSALASLGKSVNSPTSPAATRAASVPTIVKVAVVEGKTTTAPAPTLTIQVELPTERPVIAPTNIPAQTEPTAQPKPIAPTATNKPVIKKPVVVAKPPISVPSGDNKNCSDFNTHAEAQAYFVAAGPGDPNRLDNNHDGSACDSLP